VFVTCLVDAMRPSVGFAALKLLREAGCRVEVPQAQTCCGQPRLQQRRHPRHGLARAALHRDLRALRLVVAPFGSCVGMTRAHYEEALADDPAWAGRARRLGAKTFELMSFLADAMGFVPAEPTLAASATYHSSCSGLRKLEGNDVCCGFGGTFCVKYPAISNAAVSEKAAAVERTGAQLLLGGDLGCLMNMAGKLSRNGSKVRVFHAIEVLAGMTETPTIGEEV
jgi:L-lactate dehydrogenase complex protein LldE